MKDEIIQLALKAGFEEPIDEWLGPAYYSRIERLVELATAARWAELIKGVRVDNDKVVVSVKGGNAAARILCSEFLKLREKNGGQA